MKPRKPDRFERMVEKLPQDCDGGCYPSDVAALLRKEHVWVINQIRAVGKIRFADGLYKFGVDKVLEELRFRLTRRRK
jgi:hypothetical protein